MDDYRDTPTGSGALGALGWGSAHGSIDLAGDRDVFTFPVLAGLTYTLRVTQEWGAVDPVLALTLPGGDVRDGAAAGYRTQELTFTAASGEAHHLWVGSRFEDAGGYYLTVSPGVATAGDDMVRGSSLGDRIAGGDGADTIYGGAGDDILWGDSGWSWGPDGDDLIVGGAGNDIIYGGAGADTLVGGAGADSYCDVGAGDVVTERPGGGDDIVFADIDYTLGANVERLSIFGSDAIVAIGNELGNTIDGNSEDNLLRGMYGADTLNGSSGADTLYGGRGDDALEGGTGADVLIGGRGADRFVFTWSGESSPFERDVIRAGGGAAAFEIGLDRIDLSGFDGVATQADFQPLVHDGTRGLGRVWFAESGADTLVRANVDRDAAAEFELVIADGAVRAGAYGADTFLL